MNVRALSVALLLALAACGQPAAAPEPPLAGAAIGGPFTLTDQNGRPRRDRDFAGRYRIIYFGYTYCPDVCPVDVANIGQALRAFEKADPQRGARVVPIFITVDPARDTPAVLKQFVGNFHPRLIGLTGDEKTIDAVAKAYAIYIKRGARQPGGGYLVDHSRQAYLMGPDGAPMALLPADEGAAQVTAALEQWVK
jgi:protein SCO1/2